MALLWGVDLGGTKIEGVVCDSADLSKALVRQRVPTEAEQGYEHILGQIRKLIGGLTQSLEPILGLRAGEAAPKRIGIGTPGTLDPDRGTLKNSNTQCLNGKALQRDLEALLCAEVVLSNDANCFALAEALLGAGRGARCVFGVILGTGVGGGVVFDGQAWGGRQGNAGEWGHNVLIPGGAPCYCGKAGCVEMCISGPALEKFYSRHSGITLPFSEIALRARQGSDVAAAATVKFLCAEFGKAISVIINVLDPEVIVLGGGVSNVDELYTEGREAARAYVFNDRLDTRIVKHELGDSAGVFGAAMLVR
jgi:fructokinase